MNWLDSQNAIVYFKKSKNGFYYAIENLQQACLRNYLNKNNISINCYKDINLGTCNEIVDELLSIGDQAVVFYVESENIYLSSIITNLLKEEAPELIVLWYGNIAQSVLNEISKDVKLDAYVFENYENNILYLLKEDKTKWTKLNGVIFDNLVSDEEQFLKHIDINQVASVYTDGIIAFQDASSIGLLLGRKVRNTQNDFETCNSSIILDEFKEISIKCENVTALKLEMENLFSYPNWSKLLNSLHCINNKCSFEVSIYAKDLSNINMEELLKNSVVSIIINLISTDDVNQLKECISFLHNHLKKKLLKKISLYINDSILYENKDIVDILDNLIVNKKIIKYGDFGIKNSNKYNLSLKDYGRFYLDNKTKKMKDILLSMSYLSNTEFEGAYGYEVPLLNGFIMMNTGKYSNISNSAVKHVLINEQDFEENIFENLRDFISVNSGIYIQSTKHNYWVVGREYIEVGCNIIKYENEYYSAIYNRAFKNNYFLSHFNLLNSEDQPNKVFFNNYKRDLYLDFNNISLDSYINDKEIEDAYVNFITIDSIKDLDMLLEEADYFAETGKIDKSSLKKYSLANHCRWGGNSICRLNNLPRIKLDKKGNIYPCFDTNESLGKIGQLQYEVIKRSYEKTEQEYILRGCSECPVEKKCSKCVMLPNFLDKESYCEIRKKHPYLTDYLLFLDIFRYLNNNSDFVNYDIEQIKVVSECSYHFTKHVEFGNEEDYLYKPTFIIYIKDRSIIWSPVNSKFFKVSDDFVYITELMIKNLSLNQMVEQIKKDYKIDSDAAKRNVEIVYNYLFSAGCIMRQILI